jgi:hypothetical protein
MLRRDGEVFLLGTAMAVKLLWGPGRIDQAVAFERACRSLERAGKTRGGVKPKHSPDSSRKNPAVCWLFEA